VPARPAPGPGLIRVRHLVATDPGGAWVAQEGDRIVGAALALVREGVWGLSLLVVAPGLQSAGTGSALMRASLDYGDGARGGIVLASEDRRALRVYARSGFELRPAMDARGTVTDRPAAPQGVRPGRWPEDRPLLDRVSRAVRNAAHGDDVGAYLAGGSQLLVHEAGGFAVARGGSLRLLAAEDPDVAADVLRAVLRMAPAGDEVAVEFLTAGQDWAVGVVLEAGLQLHPGGAVFTRGDVGPMHPYLPSGSYL
jgi:GNAT superfamily N-acetyltransferase